MSTNVHYLKKAKSNFRREYEYRKFFFEKNAAAMYLVSAPEGTIDNCNEAFVQLLGFDSNLQVLGRRLSEFFDNTADYDSFIARFHNSDRITGDQECLRKKDGSILWILQDLYIIPDLGTNETNILGTVMDITDQKMEEENLQRGALYDSLTSLPNRSLFLDRLTALFNRARRVPDCQFAVFFLDLDRFKWVNDTFGHPVGDELLRAAAKRLGAKIRRADTIARLGGDEFAVLVNDVKNVSDTTLVAGRIEAAFQNPFRLNNREISITVSIGIALSFGNSNCESKTSTLRLEHPEDLLWEADAVLYRAKAQGRARYEIFDSAMQQKIVSLSRMEQDLRNAVERDEFGCIYEPIINLKTGHIAGFESHVRWYHPLKGTLTPGDFQLLAEQMGLYQEIELLHIRRSIRESAQFWRQTLREDLCLSVNVSASLVRNPDFVQSLKEILSREKVEPSRLHLEIPESSFIENFESMKNILNELCQIEISLGLDHFGTGFSTLKGLPEFPVKTLKIDPSLIAGMKVDQAYVDVVGTLISLGKSLGLSVSALGVESQEQLSDLKRLGCDTAQGGCFSGFVEIGSASALLS